MRLFKRSSAHSAQPTAPQHHDASPGGGPGEPGFKMPRIPDNTHGNIIERLEEMEQATISHAQRYLVRRWSNFREVGQRALIWLIVVLVVAIGVIQQTKSLSSYYQVDIPSKGGTYSEGVVGKVENFNPLFASSEAEASVSRLVFGGLLAYDTGNALVGDLASGWQADDSGTKYTVNLRPDARWHDNQPVTSADVVYTVKMIQDQATRSPLASSWKGVKVSAPGLHTVEFVLPAPFPPFPHSLTFGVIPKHKLDGIPAHQLRTAAFNIAPEVGTGPFVFKEARQFPGRHEIKLTPNTNYYGGEVKPDRFIIQAYQDYDAAVAAFANHEFSAMGGLQPQDLTRFADEKDLQRYKAPLMHEVLAFFKTTHPALSDHKVRLALNAATDKKAIKDELGGWVEDANLPLLKGQNGYDASLDKPSFNLADADKLLNDAGWKMDNKGTRKKDGKPLELSLVASSSSEYPRVAAALQRQWQKLGITIKTTLVKPGDFQQNVIIPHNYDILLYEVALGQDSDVYAYWHSSQAAEKGLNLAEYRSQAADEALEGGRTRPASALRAAKYNAFLKQWVADVPAVVLYQPVYGYVHRPSVGGFAERTLVNPVDRYYGMTGWTAEERQAIATH